MDANSKRILSFIRTKMDARTRAPWPAIKAAASHYGGIGKSLEDVHKVLEKFHIQMNTQDLVHLMNMFPSASYVNDQGLAGFDFLEFANALFPPETLDLGPMSAQHAVLPFMGRHNPFIQPVAGSTNAAPAGVTGKFEAAHAGTAIAKPVTIASHQTAQNSASAAAPPAAAAAAAPAPAPVEEAAPAPAHAGVSSAPPPQYSNGSEPQHKESAPPAAAANGTQRLLAGTGKGAAPVNVTLSGTQKSRMKRSGGARAGSASATRKGGNWVSGLKLVDPNTPHKHTSSFQHLSPSGRQNLEGERVAPRPASSAGQRSLPPAGGSAERLYALTGRSATNTGFGASNSQRAKASLALTFNRRDNERRHEFSQRRPLTASSKRHTGYPIEEVLGHGQYQHAAKPRFMMKVPGVVADPNFSKTIAGSLHKGNSWSQAPK